MISNTITTLSNLYQIAFKQDASVKELMLLVLAFSTLWLVLFPALHHMFLRQLEGRKWLHKVIERHYARKQQFYDSLGVPQGKAHELIKHDWARDWVLVLQEVTGAIFCLPSIIGVGYKETASSLAVCSVLSNLGWEVQDVIRACYVRYFVIDGELKMPMFALRMKIFHHSLSFILGLAGCYYYRGLIYFHMMTFDLQVGGIVIGLVHYGETLDIKRPRELFHFNVINLIISVTVFWTRFIHWFYLFFKLAMTCYLDEKWTLFVVGMIELSIFSYYNILVFCLPSYRRLVKFSQTKGKKV